MVRRFQQIDILEPSIEETIHIVEGLKEKYEEFHGVTYQPDVIPYAVKASVRYISDRFLEILGWEREEFAARFDNRYTALLHPDDLADGLRYRNAENSATYAQEGDSIFRMLGKNGYRWVSSAANRVEWHGDGYIVGTITDITPYMELREKLEQQNRTQREALETANRNLLRMMQQMEEQKTQFAQTTARNMEKEERYRQRLNHDALTGN